MRAATVIPLSIQRMVCSGCGAEANASCNCGVSYVPKAARAAEALKANPEKSNRAIAEEIGANEKTVRKARADQSAPETVTGKDGKSYPAKTRRDPYAAVLSDEESEEHYTLKDYHKALDRAERLSARNSALVAALNAKETQESRNWPADMTPKQLKKRDNCLSAIAAWQRDLEQLYGEVTGQPSWRVEVITKDGERLGTGARFGTRGEAEFYDRRVSSQLEGYATSEIIPCGADKANVTLDGEQIRFNHGDCVLLNWHPVPQ